MVLVGLEVVSRLVPLFVAHFVVTARLGVREYHLRLIKHGETALFGVAEQHTFKATGGADLFHEVLLEITLLVMIDIVFRILGHALTELRIDFPLLGGPGVFLGTILLFVGGEHFAHFLHLLIGDERVSL